MRHISVEMSRYNQSVCNDLSLVFVQISHFLGAWCFTMSRHDNSIAGMSFGSDWSLQPFINLAWFGLIICYILIILCDMLSAK